MAMAGIVISVATLMRVLLNKFLGRMSQETERDTLGPLSLIPFW